MLRETTMISELCLEEALADETERRRLHRKPFLREATITMPGELISTAPAFCRDISRDGIGLLHRMPMEEGFEFTLAIPLIGRQLEVQCQVNWCRQVGDDQHFSGNSYHCASTPQTLFLLSAALSDELNRRIHRRYPFIRPVTLENPDGSSQSTFCRDISRLGIGLIHREPIEPGRVTLSITSSTDADIVGTADLRRCKSIGQGWYASGGRFPVEEL